MKVLLKSTTKDGVGIQLEDWGADYPEVSTFGDTVAIYPRTIRDPTEKARISFLFANNEEAMKAFTEIQQGRREPTE